MRTVLRVTILFQTIALVLSASRAEALGGQLSLTNAALIVSVNTSNATVSVLDRRTGRLWAQSINREVVVTEARAASGEVEFSLRCRQASLVLNARVTLDASLPEFTLSLAGEGAMAGPVRYPSAFVNEAGDRLVVPMNEGISFPVEDKSIENISFDCLWRAWHLHGVLGCDR